MWSDLKKYLPTKKKVVVTLVLGIATAADVMSFAPFPGWVLAIVRLAGVTAVVITAVHLIYGFGAFRELHRSAEKAMERMEALTSAITKCCRYLRFEPHGSIEYDIDLVNRIARSEWLRNNHPQWPVARLDPDNGYLFLPEGLGLVLPGLVFSITKLDGTGISCHYTVRAEDITHEETRLTPTGFQIRAADELKHFSVDVIDPSEQEVGRNFELERFVAGMFGALNEK